MFYKQILESLGVESSADSLVSAVEPDAKILYSHSIKLLMTAGLPLSPIHKLGEPPSDSRTCFMQVISLSLVLGLYLLISGYRPKTGNRFYEIHHR